MSIVRYNNSVLNDFVPTTFSQLIDRFFNESFGRSGGSAYSFVPKADIIENEKGFEIQFALPGMSKDDFKIDLDNNRLSVTGERKFTKESKEQHLRSVETQYGAFSRTFLLPEDVDTENIEAKYTNGILEIVVPKNVKKRSKSTTIKVG
jgi:HSP20 family protein